MCIYIYIHMTFYEIHRPIGLDQESLQIDMIFDEVLPSGLNRCNILWHNDPIEKSMFRGGFSFCFSWRVNRSYVFFFFFSCICLEDTILFATDPSEGFRRTCSQRCKDCMSNKRGHHHQKKHPHDISQGSMEPMMQLIFDIWNMWRNKICVWFSVLCCLAGAKLWAENHRKKNTQKND